MSSEKSSQPDSEGVPYAVDKEVLVGYEAVQKEVTESIAKTAAEKDVIDKTLKEILNELSQLHTENHDLRRKLQRAAHFEWAYHSLSERRGAAITENMFWSLNRFLNSCDPNMTAREIAKFIEEIRKDNSLHVEELAKKMADSVP